MPTPTLTESLQRAIRDSGLSFYALSRQSGVDDGQLCRFMAGERDFTLSTAQKLCETLGLALRPAAKSKPKRKDK